MTATATAPLYALVTDDRGVYYLVYHRESLPADHDCRPRIVVHCAGPCARRLVLCEATEADVLAIKRRAWRCGRCATGGAA